MTTNATYKPAAPRQRKVVDAHASAARSIAQGIERKVTVKDEPTVQVNVPRPFTLTDDQHEQHHYTIGKQPMPKSHAEHFYAVANGVTKA